MKINASCAFSLDIIKALCHLGMFKKANPKKRMIFWGIFYGILMLVHIAVQAAYGWDKSGVIMLCIIVMVELYMCYCYFAVPIRRYHKLGCLQDAVNTYCFYDDMMEIVSDDVQFKGRSELQYAAIVRCMETSAYLFIVIPQKQVFVVDKSTINGGTAEDIRRKLLSYLGKKYMICNY